MLINKIIYKIKSSLITSKNKKQIKLLRDVENNYKFDFGVDLGQGGDRDEK